MHNYLTSLMYVRCSIASRTNIGHCYDISREEGFFILRDKFLNLTETMMYKHTGYPP